MSWLTNFFSWLATPFKAAVPAAPPPPEALAQQALAQRGQMPPAGRRRRLFWLVLHVLAVVLMVVLLAFVNRAAGVERLLRLRWFGLDRVWLPLLFLLVYALLWLGW